MNLLNFDLLKKFDTMNLLLFKLLRALSWSSYLWRSLGSSTLLRDSLFSTFFSLWLRFRLFRLGRGFEPPLLPRLERLPAFLHLGPMLTGLCNAIQLSLFCPCFVALFRLLSMAFRLQLRFGATFRCSKGFGDLLMIEKSEHYVSYKTQYQASCSCYVAVNVVMDFSRFQLHCTEWWLVCDRTEYFCEISNN